MDQKDGIQIMRALSMSTRTNAYDSIFVTIYCYSIANDNWLHCSGRPLLESRSSSSNKIAVGLFRPALWDIVVTIRVSAHLLDEAKITLWNENRFYCGILVEQEVSFVGIKYSLDLEVEYCRVLRLRALPLLLSALSWHHQLQKQYRHHFQAPI